MHHGNGQEQSDDEGRVIQLQFGKLLLINAYFPSGTSGEERQAFKMEWLEKFRRDWEGEPGGPGRDAVPGVMERLNRLDGELSNNGGSSMKDAIDRIEKVLGTKNEFTQN